MCAKTRARESYACSIERAQYFEVSYLQSDVCAMKECVIFGRKVWKRTRPSLGQGEKSRLLSGRGLQGVVLNLSELVGDRTSGSDLDALGSVDPGLLEL